MDEEMFVGEQRFAEKRVLHFIDFYKLEGAQINKFGRLQQYVKGLKATLDPNVVMGREEDPDAEENKKFDKKPAKKKTESEEEEDEDDVANRLNMNEESDEEEEDDDEDGSDTDEEDESVKDESNFISGNVFGKPKKDLKEIDIDFHNTVNETATIQASIVRISPHNQSPTIGSGKNTDFGKASKMISGHHQGEDSEDESEEEEKSVDVSKSTMFVKGSTGLNTVPKQGWKPLETSTISQNYTLNNTQQGLSHLGLIAKKKTSEHSVLQVNDASMQNSVRVIEKTQVSSNAMKGDTHNIFNKSKIADNTTMKLEFDDDEEANIKYRL